MEITTSLLRCRLLCFIYFLILGDFLPSAARKIRKACIDSEMEIFSRHGVRIEDYHKSHVEMVLSKPKHRNTKKYPNDRFFMQMEFKTTKPDGVLFYSRHDSHKRELIGLTLQDGYLVYRVRCPTLHADLLIPTSRTLNDGKWHSVSFGVKSRHYGQYGVIHIDKSSSSKRYEVTCKQITSIVVGGNSHRDAANIKKLQFANGHFEGCIRNLKLSTALKTPPKYYAVSVC